jgi:hypothetical protein
MAERIITLGVLLTLATPWTGAQELNPRYVPVPFQGDFEVLFKQRLQAAKDNAPLDKLLQQIRDNPKKFNLDPDVLKKIDLDDPALQEMMRAMADKYKGGAPFEMQDVNKLKDFAKKYEGKSGGKTGTFTPPKGTGKPPPVPIPANTGAAKTPDVLNKWLREWADQVDDTKLGDWLRDSPSFQKGILDLKTLNQFDGSGSLWGPGQLPEHLRWTEKINLNLGEGILAKWNNISLPEMPQVNLPHVDFERWSLPALRLPAVGGPRSVSILDVLLWGVVIGIAVIVGWRLVGRIGSVASSHTEGDVLGPWPVDPAHIATRTQLIKGFDYAALLLLGGEARSWNHQAIARALAGNSAHAAAARELARLYEQARYTAGPEQLSDAQQAVARRHLCLFAGVRVT